MAESAAESKIDVQKRRSTRILQAVPITVAGVDALGRPFLERTSTISINCHGCRYQSKHYVLKNMWVTIEVPHSDPHRAPRSVRARVTWIQRPRTVRELFQMAAELEIPGNLWGIAFPQPDWFPFPENDGPELVRSSAEPSDPSLSEIALRAVPAPPVDNLRILPVVASAEPSPELAQQMADLLDDARQQIQTAVNENVARAAAIETGPLLADLQKQLEQAAERSVQTMVDTVTKTVASGAPLRDHAEALAASTLKDAEERLRSQAQDLQSGWHARLHADLTAATELWDQRIESSLESAAQKSAERLARNSQAAAERLEKELGSRISSFGKVFAEATGEAEVKLNTLRAAVQEETARAQGALSQAQSAALSIEEQAGKLESLTRGALQELQRRAATVVEAQSRELAGRAESALVSWAGQLHPELESAAQQAVGRLAPQIDRELAARLQPVSQACARFEKGFAAAEQKLRRHQEALENSSDQAVDTARGRLQETVNRMTREFEDATQSSSAKWLAELDARANDTAHTTSESLFKTADWYEKKAQTQIQAALEKGLEQASTGLREKAGEISRVFASELDHYNRSYVEHTQVQIEEATREVCDRARAQSAELVADAMSSLGEQSQARVQDALAGLDAKASVAVEQIAATASVQITRTAGDLSEASRRLSAEFREALSSNRLEALSLARHEIASLADSSLGELRGAGSAQRAQLAQALTAATDQGIDDYCKRLEAASASWLLTTATRLDQESRRMIDSIAHSTEERLREACAQVFADFGDHLRQRAIHSGTPREAKSAVAGSA